MILGVRSEKNKPKIGDIVRVFHQQTDQGPKGKDQMIKKIKKMYPKEGEEHESDEDPKYERLFTLVDRIGKAINRHQPVLNKLDIKIDLLNNRKLERMKNEGVFRREQRKHHEYLRTKKTLKTIKVYADQEMKKHEEQKL